jgi:hypothetical protein
MSYNTTYEGCMILEEAEQLLKPYGIVIHHDKVLKIYQLIHNGSLLYITESDMSNYNSVDFRTAVAYGLMKEPYMPSQMLH